MGLFSKNDSSEISKLKSMAEVLTENDQFDELIKCGESITKLDPNDVDGWFYMGLGYLHMDKFEESIRCYERSLEINPRDFLIWHNLGMAFELAGKIEQAINAYQKAIEENPENYDNKNEIIMESILHLKNLQSEREESEEMSKESEEMSKESEKLREELEREIIAMGDVGVKCAFEGKDVPLEMALDRLDMIRLSGEKEGHEFVSSIASRQIDRIRKVMRD